MSTPLTITSGLSNDMVLPRGTDDRSLPVSLHGSAPPGENSDVVVSVFRQGLPLPDWQEHSLGKAAWGEWRVTLQGLPTGGPYTLSFALARRPETAMHVCGVLVGDLWVLAGQSNMEGVGDLIDVEPPSPYVHVFDMADRWQGAEEPLHWLCDSPDPCHNTVTGEEQQQQRQEARRTRSKGAGLGLPFANALVRATGVPIGLIACAHGGTSMGQWDPALKEQGGASLYGSMLRRVRLVGRHVRGLLWYQGESDANPEAAAQFAARFRALVTNVREDFGDPDLPFYTVQIGRVIVPQDWNMPDPAGWNAIQELQRRLPEEIPHTAVVPSVDLELDDLIHIGTQGLKRLGRRMARVALSALQGQAGPPPGPRLRAVTLEKMVPGEGSRSIAAAPAGAAQDCLRVAFEGVAAAGFPPNLRVTGFSLRDADRNEIPWIYKAMVDPNRPSDILLWLIGPLPEALSLWYGYGFDPPCTLADADDMAVPVFGPLALTLSQGKREEGKGKS